jgi:hypothetical protein
VDIVAGILRETGLRAEYLELEVTETTAMNNVERAGLTLKKLEALGVKIGIDDFGTSYSSLGYLKTFPIHTLKVGQLTFLKEQECSHFRERYKFHRFFTFLWLNNTSTKNIFFCIISSNHLYYIAISHGNKSLITCVYDTIP